MLVGADAERSCSRRRSVTDAACPSRVLIGPLLQFCIALSFLNVGADDSVRPQRPPLRQKKPAAFRFRRGGENSISAASFFLSKPELQTVPPSRQKKPAAFRFRRDGKSSTSASSFFLPKL